MATWFAQNSGVNIDSVNQWNSAANGSGSWLTWASLGAADILVANGKTSITINVNTTCATLTTAATGGTAGGGFLLAAGVTVTATIESGTTTCVTRSAAGATSYIIGNIAPITATGLQNNSSGDVVVTGTITGSTTTIANIGFYNVSTANVTVIGNVTGGSAGNGAVGLYNQSTGTVTITGDVTGGSASNAQGIQNTSSGSVFVTGNVTAGTATSTDGIRNISTGSVTVTGNVTATASAYGINNTSSGSIIVNTGNVTASAFFAGILMTGTTLCVLNGSGMVSSSNGAVPVAGANLRMLISTSAAVAHEYRVNSSGSPGIARTLYTGGVNLGQPVAANVRSGTTYGASSEYTGTLAVPSPTLVAIGVATDNTVGSYAPTGGLDAAGVRTAIGLATANLDTQLSGLQSDTNDIQTRLPATLESGRIAAALDPAAILAVADQVWDEATSGHTTAGTYGGRIVRATNSNTEVQITGSNHIAADIHNLQSGVITAGDFAANSITASALATDAVTEIQSGLATSAALATVQSDTNDIQATLAAGVELDSATAAKIDAILEDTGTTLQAAIAAIDAGGSGTGARTVTITVNDGTTVLQNATVRMTEGANTFTSLTNASGVAVFNLDDATHAVSITKSGYSYAGTTLVVNGTETATYSMTVVSITPPSNPSLSAIVVLCLDAAGQPEAAVAIDIRIVTVPSGSQNIAYKGAKQTATSNGNGIAQFQVVRGSVCEWKRGKADVWSSVTIDSDSVTNVTSVIGSP